MTEANPASAPAAAAVTERMNEVVAAAGAERLPGTQDGIDAFRVPRARLLDFLCRVKDEPELQFQLLLDVTAIDHYGKEPRFDVVYHLYSLHLRRRIRVKTACGERDAHVPSIVSEFPTAGFHERETYDMFGIVFDGNPDLRRILMPPEYEHHPLRKDFPLEGVEPEKVYRMKGGVMMPRPAGAEPIEGAGSSTP
jgi:NADH-quinone oxidoreductase subunit C